MNKLVDEKDTSIFSFACIISAVSLFSFRLYVAGSVIMFVERKVISFGRFERISQCCLREMIDTAIFDVS